MQQGKAGDCSAAAGCGRGQRQRRGAAPNFAVIRGLGLRAHFITTRRGYIGAVWGLQGKGRGIEGSG